MQAGETTTAARMRSCAVDLLNHGIDVRAMPDGRLRTLIAREREYFQLMLGSGEPTDSQIFRLLRGTRHSRGGGPPPRPRASRSRLH